ncbi:MAG: anhydro-N-acetylmuramic acid kinase [Candidatus Eremiobacteraeota bacterium]|nr:anhydro-N-acetylmuramic acid kinase [Candidatus Eremiobacteraeota bacterium]
MIALGLMSGTSLDGIDAALVRIFPQGQRYALELLAFRTEPYTTGELDAIRAILPPTAGSTRDVAFANVLLAQAFARAASAVLGDAPVDYVASHGQTVWHDGDAHVTLQLADAFTLREALGSTVIYDFRSADCAAGGHGAPLVPYVDALLLASPDEPRIALNVGGIANFTVLPENAARDAVVAYDTGPGNMLIDAFVAARTNGTTAYDSEGAFAARGRIDERLLAAMLAHDYFRLPPPKSTGRERFGAQFLAQHRALLDDLSLEDGAATLTALTAESIAREAKRSLSRVRRVIVSGGGTHNRALMTMLKERLLPAVVENSSTMNMDPDAKEAMAFAVLGYETLRERPANIPRVTGASRPVMLGAIAPVNLRELLQKVDLECRA